MAKILLITRPNHDPTTDYLCRWSELIVAKAIEKKFVILDLHGVKATRAAFLSYVQSKKPTLVILNGHGSSEIVAGYNNEPLLSTDDSCGNLVGKIIYIRSCNCGNELGNYLIHNDVKVFIGYKRKFMFFRDTTFTTRPLSDPVAKLFLEPSNLVATTLIKGHTAVEAHNRSRRIMSKTVRKLVSSEATTEERLFASMLWSNMQGQVLLGNPETTIYG